MRGRRYNKLLIALAGAPVFNSAMATLAERHFHAKADTVSKQLEGGHAVFVQACVLNDEIEAECEARWERALTK